MFTPEEPSRACATVCSPEPVLGSLTQKLDELSTTAEPSALTRNVYWPVVFVVRRP